ncbi:MULTISPECIES: 16S rRNA (guanine(527)-N(7))-methyltransferase RsmG [Novosphingobium]|jgi:16S rRNA (guanine527-N7)-methyltransferase|uniref:Ribosomal RNA small subunit methyltransferase G n=1 Tax=Novosphingobium subterraneum TaxID=48936 RepID=A0A0B8ZNA9_9SPHN|nr:MULTISPECIES: 16S rRNA (guanine(527)-N(7))-methyltransferase RsmG [Novosphingobium]KHS47804.1 methyltransferase GidB [Novosphingobium subterraneum]QOV93906.1 16S rRNA (guanine(527)-N(7))-methyltransferase RsmG [Novosphingobium sp. ES2-1]
MTIATEAEAQAWLRDGLEVDAATMERLAHLVSLLLEENERQNLVARGTLPHVWVRHIVDSAQLLHVSRETLPAGEWLDLGTGAGFPGLAIAALQPQRPVTLVDSRRLRTEWLQRAADVLGLGNVRVVLSRVEDLPSGPHAVISARAFAPLDKLVTLSARFSTPDTVWLLPKGAGAAQELQMLPESWNHMFHVEQSLTDANAGVICGRLLGGSPPRPSNAKGKRK